MHRYTVEVCICSTRVLLQLYGQTQLIKLIEESLIFISILFNYALYYSGLLFFVQLLPVWKIHLIFSTLLDISFYSAPKSMRSLTALIMYVYLLACLLAFNVLFASPSNSTKNIWIGISISLNEFTSSH